MVKNTSNSKSIYNTLGKITTIAVATCAMFIITTAFKKPKQVSYDKLRQSYDGLSPRDYQ